MRKFLILILGLILLLCSGTCNLYPLYLKILVEKYNLSINQINFYGTCVNIGLWLAFPAGILYDKCGPKISLFIALSFLPGSFMILHYLININEYLNLPFFLFIILALILGQGSAICYTVAMSININNFKIKDSSFIVSMLSVNVSLGPSIFTFYKQNLQSLNTYNFYYLLSIFLSLVIFICILVFKTFKINEEIFDDKSSKSLSKYRENEIVKYIYRINSILCITFLLNVFLNYFGVSFLKNIIMFIIPALSLSQFIIVFIKFKSFYNEKFKTKYLDKYEDKMRELKITVNKIQNEKFNSQINAVDNSSAKDLGLINTKNMTENSNKELNNNKKINSIPIQDISENKIKKKLVDYENDEYSKSSIEVYLSNENNIGSNYENKFPSENLCGDNSSKSVAYNSDSIFNSNLTLKKLILMFLILFLGMGSIISNYNNVHFIVDTLYFIDYELSRSKNKNMKSTLKFRILDEIRNTSNKNLTEIDIDIDKTKNFSYNSTKVNITNQILDFNNMFNHTHDQNEKLINNSILISNYTKNSSEFDNMKSTNQSIIINEQRLIDLEHENLTKIIKNKIFFYVIIYFTFNALTKLFSSFIMDFFIKKYCIFSYLFMTNLLGLFSQILGIFMKKELFTLIIAICGSCHGFLMIFIPIFVKNYSNPKHFGFILGLLSSGAALGSLINSNFLFIYGYNSFGVRLSEKSHFQVCREERCFSYSYMINSFFFLISCFICQYFIYKNKKAKPI